jgi:hypothetical protein
VRGPGRPRRHLIRGALVRRREIEHVPTAIFEGFVLGRLAK